MAVCDGSTHGNNTYCSGTQKKMPALSQALRQLSREYVGYLGFRLCTQIFRSAWLVTFLGLFTAGLHAR